MSLKDWVEMRMRDVIEREGAMSLHTIGPEKPLGSFGFPDVLSAKAVANQLEMGTQWGLFPSEHGAWLYVWHWSLAPFLKERKEVLDAHGWPSAPTEFVEFVRSDRIVPPKTELFDLISDAYGDKTNPGRRDCSKSPALCLRLFYRKFGAPDPVTVFFAQAGLKEAKKIMRVHHR